MANPERYLLALDLDGTACNSSYRLGERTKEMLTRARELGHVICFATGRRDIDMLSLGDEDRFADYLLLNTGGKLIRTSDREILFNHYVQPEAARKLITYCLEHNYQLHVLEGMYWAVNRWNDTLQVYVDALGAAPILYHTLEEVPWQHLEGLMATMHRDVVAEYIQREHLPLFYPLSEPGTIDIMPLGVTKWGGLQKLAAMLDIPTQRIIAAGDYDNDLEMIRGAGIGVAVANAQPVVKEAADYITPHDNDHDAVADIVERFLLPKE